ncbi:MAG: DNA polymerase I [Deltaproteobacteria bacterium]|nr:DNA polymerase I [Deltaproteobacteria bacterium]MCL5878230.1 DNA polymerase I [Deltaproteobacteria bacterium]
MIIPLTKRPLLFVVDGSTYIFRAYHALPPLTSKKGIPTNAVYGYTNMLIKTIEQYKPDYFVVVFDSKGPTFRDSIDAEYKANRGAPPDDLSVQFPSIFEITDTMGIQRLNKEGYEADDVIATLADRATAMGFGVVIVGSDKDLMSVVSDDVVMLDTMKDQWITSADVVQKFGVSPLQMTEFLMLTGDSIDNIRGVQGIGKKTAMDLLGKYGSIDGIYMHIEDIANKRVKTALIDAKEHLYGVTRGLVQLKHDVPVDIALDSFKMPESLFGSLQPDHRERLIKLFSEFEFRRLIDKLGKVEVKFDYQETVSIDQIKEAVKDAKDVALVYRDNEMGVYTDRAYYFGSAGIDTMKEMMSLDRRIVVHDAKAVHRFCIEHGIDMKASLFSVELAAYLCNPESKSYSMESLFLSELGEELPDISPNNGDRDNGMFDKPKAGAVYVTKAAALLSRLAAVYRERLKQDALEPLFEKIEMPLSAVLARMEHTGIRVDQAYLLGLSKQFGHQLKDLMSKMQADVPHEFNPDSPKQIAAILFDELKLPGARKTKTGYSTDSEVLEGLRDKHPFVRNLLEYRGIAKLKNSFVDTLPAFINQQTGRIHTNFIQTGAATGRLASSEPNLQNIPVKDEKGRLIRRAFIADTGNSIVSADYSQIELRIMAHLSSDEALMDAFMHDQDIHTATASGIFQVPVPDVTPGMRNTAKVVNFGIMYGISAYGLSKQLGISPDQAQVIIDSYFNEYKGVRAYIDDILNGVRQTGYVGTILGRRRYIPRTLDNPAYQRIAINTPVQGSAADLIKVAMLRIDDSLRKNEYDAKMLLQIHDELIFEVNDGQIEMFSRVIKREMEGAMKLSVPLKVSINYGKSWADI